LDLRAAQAAAAVGAALRRSARRGPPPGGARGPAVRRARGARPGRAGALPRRRAGLGRLLPGDVRRSPARPRAPVRLAPLRGDLAPPRGRAVRGDRCVARLRAGYAGPMTAARPRIDLTDPASFASGQPHEAFRWLREHDPVHWHAEKDGGPGFFAVTRYEEVREIGCAPERFSSVPTILIPDPVPGMNFEIDGHQMMLMMDPPKHTQYRRLISSEFTPRGARELAPRVRELAALIVDRVIERGECDLVEDIAGELPSYVIADLLGIPLQDG